MIILVLAEQEGFTFGNGIKPTKKNSSDIFSINSHGTISYVGFIERMALGSHAKKIGGKETLKIDFEKYIAGYDNYIKTKEINRLNIVFKRFSKCRWWDSNPHALSDNRF